MSNDVQWCVRVVKQRNIKNTAILSHKIVKVYPVVLVDLFVNNVDLLVID